jgi:GTP pyrophosphokinase
VGLLADLAANISKNGANILNVHSDIRENSTVDTIFTLAIKNTNHLNRVLAAIKKVKQITKVERIEG